MRGFGRGILAALIVVAALYTIFVWHPWNTASSSDLLSCGNGVYVQPGSSCPNGTTPQQGTTPQATTQPTQPPVTNAPPQGQSIPSASTDPAYTTPNGTAICSGDVSVKEPNGTLHSPSGVASEGEEVAITGGGYTIIFTNSASCTQYPTLTTDQINQILNNIAASQRTSGCSGGCTGQEQKWIFP